MRFSHYPAALAVASLGLAATPALADLTAQGLWDHWMSSATDMGMSMTAASQDYSGGALTLSDVEVVITMPDGQTTGTLGELVLTEQGDGTVSLAMSEEYPIRTSGTDVDGSQYEFVMTLKQTGLSMTASGELDAISYAFAAPLIEMAMTELTADDEVIDLDFDMAMNGISGAYTVTEADTQNIDSNVVISAIALAMGVKAPEDNADFSMNLTMEDIASTSKGSLSPLAAGQDLATLLQQGMSSEGQATMGATAYSIAVNDPDNAFKLEGTTGSGVLDFAMTEDGIRYGGGNTDIAMTLQVLSLPFPPFSLGIAESSGEVRMPLLKTDDVKDFGMKMGLQGVVLSDSAWGMFDPAGGLPRDPASLTLDISGLGRWNVDIMDPEATAALETAGGMPGQVDTIDINALGLSLLGADLTGSGAFTFNNSGPIPMPSGLLDLQLVGFNGLIDTLIATGLLPEEQAMGARMMLGLFARPGEGADTLVSTIEMKEDGSILANGQRIQ